VTAACSDAVAGFREPVKDFWTDPSGVFHVGIVAACDKL
jgi:hypothetical protein